jgi:toxin ParE1/3/4
MAEINWTAEAERWLKDIYDFIADDNPDAAFNVTVQIHLLKTDEVIDILGVFHGGLDINRYLL